jgi:outer membrane protein W
MKLRILILLVIATLFVPVAAAADVKKNDIGVVVGYIAPTSDSTISGVTTEADSTIDYGIAYKHKFGEGNHFGLGVSLLFASFDVQAAGTTVGSIDNMPLLVDLNWHLLESRGLYFGVTAGYSTWGKIDPEFGGSSVAVKDNVVYGVNAGWDFGIGEHFAILTNVRYLGQKVETDDPAVPDTDVTVNPVIANVGFAYRW